METDLDGHGPGSASLDRLRQSPTPEERAITAAAERAYAELVVRRAAAGACYRVTFFLKVFLYREHGIGTEAVVGWLGDGADDIFLPHAWLEYRGRKIDVTLGNPLYPTVQRPGDIVILDHVVMPGLVNYAYHRERPEHALAAQNRLLADLPPELRAILAHKDEEHRFMAELAGAQIDSIVDYLDRAPDRLGYEATASLIRS